MSGDDHSTGLYAFRIACGDGQHDAIAERDHGLFHRGLCIVAVWNGPARAQQIRFEKLVHEVQRHRVMDDAVSIRMEFGERNLAGVVFRAVIEGQACRHLMASQDLVKHRNRIHPPAEQHADFHGVTAADSGKVASVVSWMPPRGANSPRTINSCGCMTCTKSSRMRLTISSLKAGSLR